MSKYRIVIFSVIALIILVIAPFSAAPIRNSEKSSGVGSNDHYASFDSVRIPHQQYIWPTDASKKVTSSFAEYRTTHFHGGIDISTNGVKGYNVFAVRDGSVYKIRITPNGYGKMLFIKHDDGYVSTYSHLQGFNDEITTIVRQEQHRRGTYAVDLTFDNPVVQVHQGDVVAYTGDTGFGPPHLHFEIRDENLNPVNPMLFPNFLLQDNIAPFIRRIMIAPLSFTSTVENSTQPKFFSRFPRSRQVLTIPQMVRVHGLIGVGVDTRDRSEGTWSKAGIYRMEMYLDDSLTFAMELNRVPAEQTKQIDLHYDYEAISRGQGHFQKLYIDLGNILPFYFRKPAGTGIINTELLSEGKHDYRIVCYDKSGNNQELRGTILANHKPEIKLLRADTDEIVLSGNNLSSIEKCYVYGKRSFQPNWTQHTLIKGRFEIDGTGMELPINTKPYDVVKVIVESRWGSQSSPIYYFVKKPLGPERNVHLDSDVRSDHVRFSITTPGVFTETPTLTVQEGTTRQDIPLEAVDVNKYIGLYVPTEGVTGHCVVRVQSEVNGKPVTAFNAITLYVVPPTKSGSFSIDNGNLMISYDSGAVFKPLNLQVTGEENHRSTIYSLIPDDVLLNRGIKVSIPIPQHSDDRNAGMYFRTNGGWAFQTSTPDADGKTFSTTIARLLGEVAVLNDNTAPTIGRLRVQKKNRNIMGSFRYFDNLSGVDPDEIKLYLDNELIIPEIDGEHKRVWYQSEQPLDRGKHVLRVTMKDRAGNASEISRTISMR